MHRQLQELNFFSYFFNKFKHFKPDVFIYNNNKQISQQMVIDNLNIDTNITVHCDNDNEGYTLGLFSGLAKNYESYKNYDFVIHMHPDVFILDDEKIFELLKNNHSKKIDFLVTKVEDIESWYFSDFFIFKPNINFILNYHKYINMNLCAEKILFKLIEDYSLNKAYIHRYTDNKFKDEFGNGKNRIIDEYNLWHEHDLHKVFSYINSNDNKF